MESKIGFVMERKDIGFGLPNLFFVRR